MHLDSSPRKGSKEPVDLCDVRSVSEAESLSKRRQKEILQLYPYNYEARTYSSQRGTSIQTWDILPVLIDLRRNSPCGGSPELQCLNKNQDGWITGTRV